MVQDVNNGAVLRSVLVEPYNAAMRSAWKS